MEGVECDNRELRRSMEERVLKSLETNLWNWVAAHPPTPYLGRVSNVSFFPHSIMEGGVCGNRGLLVRPMEGGREAG